MGRNLFVEDSGKEQKSTGRNLFANSEENPKESLGESAMYALPRIGIDIAKSAYEGAQKLPEYYEKAKSEIPGFLNPMNFMLHPIQRGKQTMAGLLELAQKLNHAPHRVAEYGENRLNLLPQGTANKVPQAPDINEDIDRWFGKPSQPGDALARGIGRNADLLTGANAFNQAIPHLTKRGASKKLRKANKLVRERNVGPIDVNPELIEDMRQYLPNNAATRKLIEDAHYGDYQKLFDLQSDVGKHSASRARDIFSSAERSHGKEGFKSVNSLLNAMHEGVKEQGHLDISKLLSEGRKDYARYKKFNKYKYGAAGLGAAYALPKDPIINFLKKLFLHNE